MTYTSSKQSVQSQASPMLSPAKVLKKVTDEQRAGKLTIEHPQDPSLVWRVYFSAGQIHYAHSLHGKAERLNYLLKQYFPQLAQLQMSGGDMDYQWICQCWQTQNIPLNLIRQVIMTFTQEALTQILAMPTAKLEFEASVGLDPLLVSVPFRQLILPARDAINDWAQLQLSIASPFQRLTLENQEAFLAWLWQTSEEHPQLDNIGPLLEAHQCLYSIAAELQVEVLALAKILDIPVRKEILRVKPLQVFEAEKRPLVACVDDSRTIQQFVKLALEPAGYEVLSLTDPTEALGQLLERQPLMILMDIEMPKIDGYELCRMVRQVEALRRVPVVMLTGREGLIDRVRAKMIGCTAYLTKPFNPVEMLELVQKLTVHEEMAIA